MSTEEITDRGRIQEIFEEYARTRGGGLGGGGSVPRQTGVANPQGYGAAVMVAIQQGRLAVDANGNLVPGPNFDPNNEEDNYLLRRYQSGMLTDDPEAPEQEGVSVEEFEAIFGEGVINEDIVESGMYTDPETGTVYVINFPPDFEIPETSVPSFTGGITSAYQTMQQILREAGFDLPEFIGTQGVPSDIHPDVLRALETAVESQDRSAIEAIAQEIAEAGGYEEYVEINNSLEEARNIINTLINNPEGLSELEEPQGQYTSQFIEQYATNLASSGSGVATVPHPTTGKDLIVLEQGAGVAVDVGEIGAILEAGGNFEDVLDAIVPYIPGIELPEWFPSAGIIFLPSVGEIISEVSEVVSDIGNVFEDSENVGDIIGGIVEVVAGAVAGVGDAVADKLEEIIGTIIGEVSTADAGTILGGVVYGTYGNNIPDWVIDVLRQQGPVYDAVREAVINAGGDAMSIPIPVSEEEEDEEVVDINEEDSLEDTDSELAETVTETDTDFEEVSQEAEQTTEEVSQEAEQTTEEVSQEIDTDFEEASQEAAQTTEEVSQEIDTDFEEATQEAAQTTEEATQEAEQTTEEATEEAEQTTEEATQTTEEATQTTEEATEEATQEATQTTEEATQEAEQTTEEVIAETDTDDDELIAESSSNNGGGGGGFGGGSRFTPTRAGIDYAPPGFQGMFYQSPVNANSIIEQYILKETGRKKGMLV